jgi:nitrogen regulation protein NR(I)
VATVLIADDEANLRKVLATLLGQEGHDVLTVADGAAALETVQDRAVDILLTDLRMPGMSGLELLDSVQRSHPWLPVIVITAHGSVETAVSALKRGAVDYVQKPFDKDELRVAVRKALAAARSAKHTSPDTSAAGGRFRIIGISARMQEIFTIIEKVAATPSTVLITGESGTGKELVATALHEHSDRAERPLIRVNCAAIPKDLLESEFFGHEKGAFTGAVGSKPGRFELADGGTLFLDEIADIPIEMQVKLLRALQEGQFERVGGVKTIDVDVRLVAATNRDLAREIEAGQFREDLFYRLNVVPIHLPPLRDRPEDIRPLAEGCLERCNGRLGKQIAGISSAALEVLERYPWPGNVRELENVIERTVLFADGPQIDADDLPEELRRPRETSGTTSTAAPTPAVSGLDTGNSMKDIVRQATASLERDLIIKALDETRGNVTRAAHLLRISRKGLQNKMKELGLRERPGDDA